MVTSGADRCDHVFFSSHVTVLVNGRPTEEFQSTKGLDCDGDPHVSFLFIMAVEELTGLMRNPVEKVSIIHIK